MKQRGAALVAVYRQESEELSIYKENSMVKPHVSHVGGGEIIGMHQQPLSLVFHSKRAIGFFKLNKKEVSNDKQMCRSNLIDIDEIAFDASNPSILLAISKS